MQSNSKLTQILLVIIIILLAGGIYLLTQKNKVSDYSIGNNLENTSLENINSSQDTTSSISSQLNTRSQNTSSQSATSVNGKVFNGQGFSLVIPEKYGGNILNYSQNNGSISGKETRGYFSTYPNPSFRFAMLTSDFSSERGLDCGESKRYPTVQDGYEQKINKQGVSYMYKNESDVDGYFGGSHKLAYFKLNNSEFPVLGFCAFSEISDTDFYSVIDSVVIK